MQIKKQLLAINQNYKAILQAILGLLFVGFGIYFIKKEQLEMGRVKDALFAADPIWVMTGVVFLLIFILVQGLMYKQSFKAIHEDIKLSTGMGLFLKRNLISVFLPAGVLTNMLFFNKSIEKKEGVSRSQIYFASSIFSFCSILSAVIIGIPALLWLLIKGTLTKDMIWGVLLTSILLIIFIYLVVNLLNKGRVFHFLEKKFPSITGTLNEFLNQSFNQRRIGLVLLLSILIEIIGITHLYISIIALGAVPTLEIAIIGYAIVLLLLMSSPFLRGIGAVEVALTYALVLFGMSHVLAISIAFLFRFFEFWSVLIVGVITIISQKNNLFLRISPALLLFILGIVNIISGITPAVPLRLRLLRDLIPLEVINASNWLVILSGIFMFATSIFLIRGLRSAWISALTLSGLSLIFHLTKGFDWEEALFAFITFIVLIYQRKQYFIRPDLRFVRRNFIPLMGAFIGILFFATVGLYLLNVRDFNQNLSLSQSFAHALSLFFLLNNDLTPLTPFAKDFIHGINFLGGLTMIAFVVILFRPIIYKHKSTAEEDLLKAKALVEKYGVSALDYFKTYYDKKIWFNEDGEGFLAFRNSKNYAIVLENPVCENNQELIKIISEFDKYCIQNGLRAAYYRVPETTKTVYEELGKNVIPIGEVAVVNVETFALSGQERKPMRNAISKLTKLGYTFHVHKAPQKDSFLQQLKATSDEWLKSTNRRELVYSQGLYDEKELKNQDILTIENQEGKVVGFVNIIPDYTKGEANFDLMRKTSDAPGGTMDFLFANMFEYLKSIGFKTCNMGMVPMSGIDKPENLQERIIKLAYEKLKQFGHYKSLRSYKEKFNPQWEMSYLVYNDPFDLIFLPAAIGDVIKA